MFGKKVAKTAEASEVEQRLKKGGFRILPNLNPNFHDLYSKSFNEMWWCAHDNLI